MFRSQQIIIREYVCTSLKLLNYLKNTEFKILEDHSRCCGSKTVMNTTLGMIFRILNCVFLNNSVTF